MRPSSSRKRILEIVTSGYSGRSCPSTSPMLMNARDGMPAVLGTATSAALLGRPGPGQEHQAVLADLDLVTTRQRDRLDALPVEVGAVEAPHVSYDEAAALAEELRVPAGDGHVVEEDVAVGVTSRGGDVGVEQEARSRVRSPLHHEQRRSGGQRLGDARLVLGALHLAGRALHGSLEGAERDRRGAVDTGVARAATGRRPAARAEAAVVGVLLAALGAEHGLAASSVRAQDTPE